MKAISKDNFMEVFSIGQFDFEGQALAVTKDTYKYRVSVTTKDGAVLVLKNVSRSEAFKRLFKETAPVSGERRISSKRTTAIVPQTPDELAEFWYAEQTKNLEACAAFLTPKALAEAKKSLLVKKAEQRAEYEKKLARRASNTKRLKELKDQLTLQKRQLNELLYKQAAFDAAKDYISDIAKTMANIKKVKDELTIA